MLKRIHAVNYGGLTDRAAEGLGPGLTVVLGENEVGKSSLRDLVRHVLYGFPRKNARDRTHIPDAGDRHGELVFGDASGEWQVVRTDGAREAAVATLSGADRPGLVGELTAGVTQETFQIVFCFGLDEMQRIEDRDIDVVGRLYAGATGLEVDPVEVRKRIEHKAAELFVPRASAPRVNALRAEAEALRSRIRDLEGAAASVAEDRRRLADLRTAEAESARRHADADILSRTLVEHRTQLGALAEEAARRERDIAGRKAEIEALEGQMAERTPDEAVLASAAVLRAALEDLSGFRRTAEAMRERAAACAALRERIAGLGDLPEGVRATREAVADLEAWTDRLRKLEVRSEQAKDVAAAAERTARAAELETAGPAAAASQSPLAWGLVAVGLLGVVAGLALDQWAALAIGLVAAAAGAWLLAKGLRRGASGPADAARPRAEADAAAEAARTAEQENAAALAEWCAWLSPRGLDASGTGPAAVRELLGALKARDDLVVRLDAESSLLDAARADAEAWVSRLAAAAPFLPGVAAASLEEAPAFAERARELLELAESTDRERREISGRVDDARAHLASEEAACKALGDRIGEIASEHGLGPATATAEIARLAEEAGIALEAAKAEHEAAAQEASELAGKVDSVTDEAGMAMARQELEGIERKMAALAEKHLVLAVAARLLGEAQAVYERDRQPDVLRAAGEHFRVMTGGAYERVVLPLGGGPIAAVTPAGRLKTTDRMSTGAAQQLYLALRVGLIEQLGDVGAELPVLMDDVVVNFDPKRRAGAAHAVAELASHRQVVFFTCHPETASALADASPGCVQVRL